MKKRDASKLIIVLLAILLIVLLAIVYIVNSNPTNKNLRYIYNKKEVGNIEKMPLNVMYVFSDIGDKDEQRSIYKALYLLVDETIPKYRDLVTEIEAVGISKYFKANKLVIAKELGIAEEEDFISFIETIKDLKGKLILSEYTFHPDAVYKVQGYLRSILLIKYENNEKIGLYIKIPYMQDKSTYAITCAGGVLEKYLEYEYGSEFENEENTENTIESDFIYTPTGRAY